MTTPQQRAERFLADERAFRLGALQTEASHPKTRTLSQTLTVDTEQGIRMLQSVDGDIVDALDRLFARPSYERLVHSLVRTWQQGGRAFFTGCGATGRLSILLEAAWREFWQGHSNRSMCAKWQDRCISVMAGGDYALIKSVEGFEDFPAFGRRQLREAGVQTGDVVVAITEGGETPFVIGTAWEGLDTGAEVFFVYNNPTDLLREHVQRSREVIDEPRIHKLDLSTGPMAVTGSTRMQATTAELLVVGAALERALEQILDGRESSRTNYPDGFRKLIEELGRPEGVTSLARATRFETGLYRQGGLVTYGADWGLLDILTDTTERSPTFMVPAFRPWGDEASAPSWAFVKHPTRDTVQAWDYLLKRAPRGLTWNASDYRALQAPEPLPSRPPDLSNRALYRFRIGNETDASRTRPAHTAYVAVSCGPTVPEWIRASRRQAKSCYERTACLIVGPAPLDDTFDNTFHCPCHLPDSPLQLWRHLALKLVLNTLSTATMACLGRVLGNAMIWVSPSNKKLIDRGCRLIAQTTGCSYERACVVLHECMAEPQTGVASPVAAAIERLGFDIDKG
jgi:N-acetylmuramic acid 6-phosphate etherase